MENKLLIIFICFMFSFNSVIFSSNQNKQNIQLKPTKNCPPSSFSLPFLKLQVIVLDSWEFPAH